MYVRKTRDEWELQQYFGVYGWERLATYETLKETKEDLKLYMQEMQGFYQKRPVHYNVFALFLLTESLLHKAEQKW